MGDLMNDFERNNQLRLSAIIELSRMYGVSGEDIQMNLQSWLRMAAWDWFCGQDVNNVIRNAAVWVHKHGAI